MTTPKTDREKAQRVIAENRKARHDYHILETWEAGVALLGTEVKAIREGRVNLRDSYARVERSEIWMLNVHISPYSTDFRLARWWGGRPKRASGWCRWRCT
jgi:SsrA-binding protein